MRARRTLQQTDATQQSLTETSTELGQYACYDDRKHENGKVMRLGNAILCNDIGNVQSYLSSGLSKERPFSISVGNDVPSPKKSQEGRKYHKASEVG